MHGTIARLIDAHAAEVGEAKLEIVDIDALFAQAAAAAAAVAAEKRIRIVCEPSWLRARAEPSLLSHALGNLVSNAIKYPPLGSAVRLKAEACGAGVRICVSDRGPGIAPEEADRLFGKFARLSALPTAAEPNLGTRALYRPYPGGADGRGRGLGAQSGGRQRVLSRSAVGGGK